MTSVVVSVLMPDGRQAVKLKVNAGERSVSSLVIRLCDSRCVVAAPLC